MNTKVFDSYILNHRPWSDYVEQKFLKVKKNPP